MKRRCAEPRRQHPFRAAFVALTPAMTALLAIPILGEWPSAVDWMAVDLISLGVYTSAAGRWQHRAFLGSSRRKCRGRSRQGTGT
jgi:hypothetical protein